jgi:putative PIN family toxin of toxin-antitoxin system
MNALIDTNVILSAALRNRLPERVVLFVATHENWRWLVTPEINAEYLQVLRRPKFGLTLEMLSHWETLLNLRTVKVGSPPIVADFPRDPKDAPFLAAALDTRADLLITGDRDLLDARNLVPTRIVSVSEFAHEFQVS